MPETARVVRNNLVMRAREMNHESYKSFVVFLDINNSEDISVYCYRYVESQPISTYLHVIVDIEHTFP